MKLCIECKHLFCKTHDGVWYNYFCYHPSQEHPKAIDPVSGKMGFGRKDSDGEVFFIDGLEQFPNAREVNLRGECGLWEQNISFLARLVGRKV